MDVERALPQQREAGRHPQSPAINYVLHDGAGTRSGLPLEAISERQKISKSIKFIHLYSNVDLFYKKLRMCKVLLKTFKFISLENKFKLFD